jgi:Holliday junction resolvase-like predicted endonuclease
MPQSDSWKDAQSLVANFLAQHGFQVSQEKLLQSGKRIDILAVKKIALRYFHILVEVKNWAKVTRQKEKTFCEQIKEYLIEYALEHLHNHKEKHQSTSTTFLLNNRFIGILCLTKDTHFSFRKVSSHTFKKNAEILGMKMRERLAENIDLYVTRFDFLSKVFQELSLPLSKQQYLTQWLSSENNNE